MTNAYMTHAAYIYGLAFSGVSKGLEERSIKVIWAGKAKNILYWLILKH